MSVVRRDREDQDTVGVDWGISRYLTEDVVLTVTLF